MQHEIKEHVEELLNELADAKEAMDLWLSDYTGNFFEDRRRWAGERSTNSLIRLDPDRRSEHESREPGLSPILASIKIKIANLKRDLAEAEAEFATLVQRGTPFKAFFDALAGIEVSIMPMVHKIRQQRLNTILEEKYGPFRCDAFT
jgi:hypothetical protein